MRKEWEYGNLAEQYGQLWALELRTALQEVYHQHKAGTLTVEGNNTFYARFNELVQQELLENPEQIKVLEAGGKSKKGLPNEAKVEIWL